MKNRQARLYDMVALFTAVIIIVLDQWTKSLVVEHLSPPESHAALPIIGDYLSIYYIQNSGTAFSLFANNTPLAAVFIIIAIGVIFYLYIRLFNTEPFRVKIIFGMIIGGAAGNLLDRAIHGGSVVDFIWFRIPEIGYRFAIFNIADASISVGIFLLFVFVLFGGLRKSREEEVQRIEEAAAKDTEKNTGQAPLSSPPSTSGTLRATEQDAQ